MLRRRNQALFPLALVPIFLAVGCAVPEARDPMLAARLDRTLTRLADTGAIVSARVLELPGRQQLYSRDIDRPCTPASNMKIAVSAAGLDMFGADHTFKTYLALDGDDLWVIGTGDPGLGDPRLEKGRGRTPVSVLDDWADALEARGVTHIAGDLYYYDAALDHEWTHPTWGDDVLHWYGAPISGLNFHDNCVDITIYPTEPGRPVRYEVMPPVQGITIINECLTASGPAPASAPDDDEGEATIAKLPEGNIYKLGGVCREKTELKSKPVDDPGAFFADALRTHFASRGITIAGEARQALLPLDDQMPPPADKIAAVHETTVRDILSRINTNSQNLFADVFCKLTGQAWAARQGRHVPGSWVDGAAAIRAFLRRNRVDDAQYRFADGSGLSDHNKVTARMLTDLFAAMFARPDFEVFLHSLAKGGIDGTLEKRFAGYAGHVYAKTGYIEGVRSLSGYVKTNDGRWLTFSILYNQIPGDVKPYEQLQDEAVKQLVQWPELEEIDGQPGPVEAVRPQRRVTVETEVVPVRAKVVSAADFALYSIRRVPNESHAIPVQLADGTSWYREAIPGLDLRNIELQKLHVADEPGGSGAYLVISVNPAHFPQLEMWSNDRIGGATVFLLHDRPVGEVVQLDHALRGGVTLRTCTSEEARRIRAELAEH